MLCWSCRKEILDTAEFCPHCEAEVTAEPTEDEKRAVEGALAGMDPDLINELRQAFEESSSGEEFVNRIMIGDCPKCGSSTTGDCEKDPEIDDIMVARCFDCGQLWCPDCGEWFQGKASVEHECPAWDDMEFELDDWEEGDDEPEEGKKEGA